MVLAQTVEALEVSELSCPNLPGHPQGMPQQLTGSGHPQGMPQQLAGSGHPQGMPLHFLLVSLLVVYLGFIT